MILVGDPDMTCVEFSLFAGYCHQWRSRNCRAGLNASRLNNAEQMYVWCQLFGKQDSSKTDLRSTCMQSLGLRRVREDFLGSF